MLDLKVVPFAAIGAVPTPETGRAVVFLSTVADNDTRLAVYAKTPGGVVLLWSQA